VHHHQTDMIQPASHVWQMTWHKLCHTYHNWHNASYITY